MADSGQRKLGDTVFNFHVEGEPGQARIMGQQTLAEFERFLASTVPLNRRLAFVVHGKLVWRGYGVTVAGEPE